MSQLLIALPLLLVVVSLVLAVRMVPADLYLLVSRGDGFGGTCAGTTEW
jgi:hypothetical protein